MLSRALAVLTIASIHNFAQDPSPTFRSTTNLVDFTFIALDRDGKPVTDLRMDEITIIDKGQNRTPVFFRFEAGVPATTKVTDRPTAAGMYTNRTGTAVAARNLTAIVLDTLNTLPENQQWTRAQLMQYLGGIDPTTRVGLYGLDTRLRVFHDFTDDASGLRARIGKLTTRVQGKSITDISEVARQAEQLLGSFPEGSRGSMEDLLKNQIESLMLANEHLREQRVKRTLASLEALGKHLSGIPGRKSLVWIGSGIPMMSMTGVPGSGARGIIKSYEPLIRATSQQLATHGIVLYIVDARGLYGATPLPADIDRVAAPGQSGPFDRQTQAAGISADTRQAMLKMAAITGGRVFRNTNDMAAAVKAVDDDARGTYSVGFYAAGEPDNKWHNLGLKVSRPGVKLFYRQGYLSIASAPIQTQWSMEHFRTVAINPMGSTAIRLDARCERGVKEARPVLLVTLSIGVLDLHLRKDGNRYMAEVEIGVVQKDVNGLPIDLSQVGLDIGFNEAGAQQLENHTARHSRAWPLDRRTASVRIIVRDLRGGYGTLDIPLSSVPLSRGPDGG